MDRLIGGIQMLAEGDGLAAWHVMVGEVRRTLDDPLRGLPVLGLFVLVIVLLWVNYRVVRWLMSPAKDGTHLGVQSGPGARLK